jgi:hypothetical protein
LSFENRNCFYPVQSFDNQDFFNLVWSFVNGDCFNLVWSLDNWDCFDLVWSFDIEIGASCQLERLLQSFSRALTTKIASILFREMRLKFQYVSLRDCDFLWCRNYNYGAASAKVGANILAQPYLVSQDPILAFKSSLYFWTSGPGTIPSIHEVLIGKWKPSKADQEAGRKPGFGVTIDIINGG